MHKEVVNREICVCYNGEIYIGTCDRLDEHYISIVTDDNHRYIFPLQHIVIYFDQNEDATEAAEGTTETIEETVEEINDI
jgi:hypothetical protein